MNSLHPLHDRVLVKLEKRQEKTAGGIFIPDSANKSPIETGTVEAVGDGRFNDGGAWVRPTVQIGDKVIFGQYAGANIDVPGLENHMLVRDYDILAILKEAEDGE